MRWVVWIILGLWIATLIALAHFKLSADSKHLLWLECREDREKLEMKNGNLLQKLEL